MVYSQENIGQTKFRRVFTENVDSEELVWHRDREDREVFVESGNGWMLQMDNELPQVLQEGQTYFIPKETYHRVIKGSGDLKIVIDEGVNKVRVPKAVQKEVKRGLFYQKKNINHPLLEDYVSKNKIEELREYFNNKKRILGEGKLYENEQHIDYLLHGGESGEKWVRKVLK